MARLAMKFTDERPHGPHDLVVNGASQLFDVRPLRIAQRFAPGVDREVDRRGFAEVRPLRWTLRREQIDQVTLRFALPGLYIVGRENGKLDQGAPGGKSSLNGGERDRLRMRAKLFAARAQLRF